MAKVSPLIRALNAGEFSALMEGRVDIDRYPSSLRKMEGFISSPQGPAVARSGTMLQCPLWDETKTAKLQPFVFNETQSWQIEFAAGRCRFINEDGPICYPVTDVQSVAGNIITSNAHGAVVGEQVVLTGFSGTSGMNGEQVKVTAVTTNTLTVDRAISGYQAGAKIARIYHVANDFSEADLDTLRTLQSADVMYIFSDTKRTKKLSRYGLRDWRLTDFAFTDGPYIDVNDTGTRMTPSATGLQSAAFTTGLSATQQLIFKADCGSAVTLAGYSLHLHESSADPDYSNKDIAPSTWTFEGSPDDATWTVLDRQQEYVLYTSNRSVFFPAKTETAFRYYRINVTASVRNGPIQPSFSHLDLTKKTATGITLNFSAVTGINADAGFKSTDVGRQIRVKQGDGYWRALTVTAVNSTTQVVAAPQGEGLLNLDSVSEWRLGAFCDTNGWPTTGAFFEDRLVMSGAQELPDLVACSATGSYEAFPPSDTDGTVTASNAIVFQLNSRKLSRVAWISSDERGLLIGTGSQEWVVAPADTNQPLSGANIRARSSTARGSARMEPCKVDRTVLFCQRARRTVREFVYVFQADGYQSPSMSLFSSHIGGASRFMEMDYAAEPHSLVWFRQENGALACLTYNRDENVVGWSRHPQAETMAGAGVVESMSVMPSKDGDVDTLWLVVRRVINGQTRRFIERLMPFWDFNSTLDTAHFVDCALRYQGAETVDIYGLQHLEGETVYGLADGGPVPPLTVTGGKVTLPYAASNVILGLGFDAEGEIARIEGGAADGTAQGKTKRIHNVSLRLWQTGGGEVGVPPSENLPDGQMTPLFHRRPDESFGTAQPLRTEDHGPLPLGGGYDKAGTIVFRRPKHLPLPFNLIAIMPQLNTQDR